MEILLFKVNKNKIKLALREMNQTHSIMKNKVLVVVNKDSYYEVFVNTTNDYPFIINRWLKNEFWEVGNVETENDSKGKMRIIQSTYINREDIEITNYSISALKNGKLDDSFDCYVEADSLGKLKEILDDMLIALDRPILTEKREFVEVELTLESFSLNKSTEDLEEGTG